jgi:signal transduction histidine kinase
MWRSMRWFLGGRTEGKNPLVEFEDGLLLIVDPEQLASNLCAKLQRFMDIERSVVYLPAAPLHVGVNADTDGAFGDFSAVALPAEDRNRLPDIAVNGRLAGWFGVNREILLFKENQAVAQYLQEELQPFLDWGMGLAFPLVSMDRLIGLVFLCLGDSPVSGSQLANLQVLSRQAGLAFENALLFRDRLRQNERMYRAEQLAAMGQFAAGIAHELRNPLTAIRSTVQFLADEFAEDSEPRRLTKTMLDEIDRLNNIVGDLLLWARPAEGKPVAVDLKSEIDKCIAFIEAQARSQDTRLEFACTEPLPKPYIDPAELRQVLLNVMMNGLQAMPVGGTLHVWARRADQVMRPAIPVRARILVEVRDQGPGVPAALREKVFELFFTTKPGGTGLGLPICRSIVRRYGGEIWLEEAAAGGTSAKILLTCE